MADSESKLLTDVSTSVSVRASSVLQKNSKLYGPRNALDLVNTTTCWNSEGDPSGSPVCFFIVDFGRPVEPAQLKIQFQAGFVGEEMDIFVSKDSGSGNNSWTLLEDQVEVEDDHELQEFALDCATSDPIKAIKLEFKEFTDFYGRVTIYQLQVWGKEVC
eukprot:Nitzschia sp. Nitz4//scaffold50_size126154//112874//113419//NITZ4_003704-RA/size126154-augustus-gene-0.123-mRNA-1//1//CDS//3329553755//7298//frame0